MKERKVISVFGSSSADPKSELYGNARTLGRLLAEAGFDVMNGGYHGTMEAVSRGAKEGGGQVTGITLSLFDPYRPSGNKWLDEEIKKSDYMSRLEHLTVDTDGCIALEGKIGTLTEVFAVWSLEEIAQKPIVKPLILLGDRWRRLLRSLVNESFVPRKALEAVHVVLTPEEAVQVLVEKLARNK